MSQTLVLTPEGDVDTTTTASGLQVVACGLPRTGTTTIGLALAILLDGTVLDGIQDTFLHGTASQQQEFLRMNTLAPDDPELLPLIEHILTSRLPYKATTDAPFTSYVSELITLYPDAKFVCTIRPFEPWYAFFTNIQHSFTLLVPYAWLWPSLRRCIGCVESGWKNRLRKRCISYAIPAGRKLLESPVFDKELLKDVWDTHIQHLRETVPERQLLMFDVRDGWKPLCDFLGKPVATKMIGKDDGSGDFEEVELEFPH
ncbi:unnamed protein product [Zymoseptoria tritici ST99CH_1E4]|uniref:Sulfotransferase domain-containing protein n=1 Tax=Zymoseptoria tritici ST99CH_1E4 TaxID=1276532 RepID=A0A2H1GEY9_ZYMTR|nr:unnamed protein product [Zymoseptoria tritici ST99CH_1E4]